MPREQKRSHKAHKEAILHPLGNSWARGRAWCSGRQNHHHDLRITGSGSAWFQPAGSHLRKEKKFTWIAGAAGQGSKPSV